jgi:hypothetical protein
MMRRNPTIPGSLWKLLFIALLLFAALPGFSQPIAVGEVSFANSGAPAAQEAFLRGLALLHDFEYDDAAASFRAAQKIDPAFAMAYWGEAMTFNHPVWMQQDRDAARAVLSRLGSSPEERAQKAGTEREREYLRAVEILYGEGTKEQRDFKHAEAMAAIHQHYPGDVDATALYALSLLGTAHQGRDFATYMRAAALLEEVFPTHLHHPGVLHYLIHCYDDPIHAPLGLRAARLYGEVASFAPHALHMTSHIFIALGMWDDVIDANRKSSAAFDSHHAGMAHPRGCGHGITWLAYGLLQERRFAEARQQIDACRQAALIDEYKGKSAPIDYDQSKVTSFAEMRVLESIESGTWGADAFVVPAGPYEQAAFTLAYGAALAAARGNDVDALTAAATALHGEQKKLLAVIDAAKPNDPSPRQRAEIEVEQIDALARLRAGRTDEGLTMLRKAAADEGAMALAFGPPQIEKPSFELLGDELLRLGRAAEARKAFETALARAPGRTLSLQGMQRAETASGDLEAAGRTATQLALYVRTAGH